MADTGNWCLIESDPGVFTELIRDFGCKGIQVEELYGLDPSCFEDLRPVHGLIFLFKWRPGEEPSGSVVADSRLEEIFFAQQVIQNACASQALINLLMNCDHDDIDLGPILHEFKQFTAGFDPTTKGLCLSNAEQIRKVHNSFSRQHIFEIDMPTREKDDNFHFICYLPYKGRVYELDGLREGPIDLGKVSTDDWLDVARPAIEQRIQRYSGSEIRFNLMAVISDKRTKYQKMLNNLVSVMENVDETAAEEICRLQTLIADEEAKAARFHAENIRRKHNYIPFIVELLKILAEEGKLVPLIKDAKQKAKEKAETEKRASGEGSKAAS